MSRKEHNTITYKDILHNKVRKEEKYIYIILSQTQTYTAKAIRFYTREPYAHASIAFDENLDEMYSFARRKIRNPFNAGFIKENINEGIFGKCTSTTCNIYKLKVSERQYKKLRRLIQEFEINKEKYSYNFLGILGIAFHIPVVARYRFFCSQFVAYLLERSDIRIFPKNYALIKPKDIRLNPFLESVYHGKLADYRITKSQLIYC